ncbi:MAG: hypothetical protein JST92_26210, partial [Deltaproteobacteria bacterium]|nr:hypothetical protein [Deltaproteobacteria bacterium]
ADDLELDFDGPFQFATTAQNGTPFHVTVKTQPADPLQRCDIDGADGKVDGDVTSVNVTCTTLPYFNIGGMVTGLLGQGLILENLGGDDLAITKNGQFTFATQQQTTLPYSVTVRSQPFGPYQLCTVTAGDGTVADADVLSVNVVCATSPFFDVGGTVSGLTGSGLVLQNDGGDDLLVSATGTFHFATQVQENVPYLVTIKTQPANPNQTCTLTNAGGVVGAADVTSVHVACADNPKFSLGGSVSGLTGAGLVLHASTGENLAVTSTGAFTFAQKLQGGTRYRVSVGTQPSGQTCSVSAHGEGTIAANVGNVQVVCGGAARYSLGVQVSGLTGSGLLLTTAAGDELAVNSAGTSTFADSFADGAGYAVTVTAQPGAPQQLCAFDTASAGTFAGADVLLPVTCTTQPFFTIGGVVTGNAGQGLTLLNAGEQLVVSGNGAFAFSTLAQSGTPYDITVAQQPNAPLQTCIVTGGHGVVTGANPGGISVNCTTNTFFLIGGSVSGVVGTGLVLQNNGADDHTITQDGFFIFSTNLQAGRTFAVSVKTQPNNPPQTCTVNNGSGVVTRNMVSAQIVCAKNPTSVIGGTVSGLTGSGLVLQDNVVDPLTITGNGGFGFATALNLGATYSVTVRTQPTNPSQTCRVVNGAGRTAGTNVNSVTVTCSPVNFKVGGFVSGLPAGAKVNLLDNGFDALTVSGTSTGATDVTYSFGTSIASGRAYTVTVTGQSGGVS